MKVVTIEVKALSAESTLHPLDAQVPGTYSIEVTDEAEDWECVALDKFHALIPIKCLGDFGITAELAPAGKLENPAELAERYGYWGEHPVYSLDRWHYDANNDDTRLGYWEWVARQEDEAQA